MGSLRKHFMFRHFRSKMAAFQEGKYPLPRCDLCRMHIPAGWLIRNSKMALCYRNTQMRWRRRDVAISYKCLEAKFILSGEEEAERI